MLMAGWWYTYPAEKYEFVSWDDYSQYMESHKIHVPNHQTAIVTGLYKPTYNVRGPL